MFFLVTYWASLAAPFPPSRPHTPAYQLGVSFRIELGSSGSSLIDAASLFSDIRFERRREVLHGLITHIYGFYFRFLVNVWIVGSSYLNCNISGARRFLSIVVFHRSVVVAM